MAKSSATLEINMKPVEKTKVLVAMSGGIDSTITALILNNKGYQVSGGYLHLKQVNIEDDTSLLENNCRILDIKLHHFNCYHDFKENVINYFSSTYQKGATPNPCIVCNQKIKFGFLLAKAREMGMDYLATGHYARITINQEGYHLLAGIDATKDQSYFLYRLGQNELQNIIFPLGSLTKKEVRGIAADANLPFKFKSESQDICFIENGNYRTFLSNSIPTVKGDIVDINNVKLGGHEGLMNYTVGQRQGLGISYRNPLYVLGLDATKNRLIVGEKEQLTSEIINLEDISWIAGEPPRQTGNLSARIRNHTKLVPVDFESHGNGLKIFFKIPQVAVTPGQSLVIYREEEVLGGGIIINKFS